MRKYLALPAAAIAVSLLSWNFLGRLPNGMGALAVVLFLRAHHVGYGRLGLVTALYAACSAVGGPLLGRLVDRRGQFAVLLGGALLSGAGFTLLALFDVAYPPVTVLGVALAGFFMPPLEPALRSVWPDVLPDESTVEVAYALDSSLQNILYVGGPLLVVLLFGVTSPEGAVLAIGALGVVGTLAFVSVRPAR